MMITCTKCGNSVANDLRFCTECGNQLIPSPSSQDGAPTIALRHFTPADAKQAVPAPSAARSSHTGLIITATVVTTVVLIAFGGLALRLFTIANSTEKERQQASPTPTINSNPSVTPLARRTPTAQSTPSKPGYSPSTPNPNLNTSSTRQSVVDTLEAWAAAIRAHDLDSHMSFYAPTLHTYYLKHDVSSAYVRNSLQPAYDRYSKLDVSLSNIAVSLDETGTEATVTLDKTYSFVGDKTMSGSGKEMLWLSRATGRWLITGMKDLQIYYKSN
jgi:hypothetical protein